MAIGTVRLVVRPVVPTALRTGPFTFDDAQRAGLTRKQLRGASWKRISYGHYIWAGLQESPELVLADVHRRLPPKAAFSGRTAAWLHGLDFPPCDPIEATFLIRCGTTTLTGVAVHRTSLPDADLIVRSGLPTTSALRTVFDLGSRPPLVEAVGAVDMALRAGVVNLADIRQWADEHSGARGIRQFRRVVELAEPLAESPMETRLRMLLVLARLPRPEAQVSLNDSNGRFLGRVDLYYPAERLALEYDGGTHRTSLIEDNRRQNLLLNAGYHVLRFTVADIRETSDAVVRQVRAALGMKSKRRAALRRQAQ